MAQTITTVDQSAKSDSLYLGETPGFWCQTGVLLLAALIAVVAMVVSRRIERRKASAAVLFSTRRDGELTRCLRHITTIHATDQNMAMWARKDKNDSEEAKSIRYALNHWEDISVGIAHHIYDEEIFKSTNYTTVRRLYERTKPFIDEVRRVSEAPTAFQEFECLACRWKLYPLERKEIVAVPT